MGRRTRRIAPMGLFLACAALGSGGFARAQTQTGAPAPARPPGRVKPAGADAKAKPQGAAPAAKPRAQEPRREPSEARKEEIRKTVEQRRQRRARRAQARGSEDLRPVGAIVPWPMPPALIIRQTPQVHDEVGSLLGGLRRGR
jgi:hypothetical protein